MTTMTLDELDATTPRMTEAELAALEAQPTARRPRLPKLPSKADRDLRPGKQGRTLPSVAATGAAGKEPAMTTVDQTADLDQQLAGLEGDLAGDPDAQQEAPEELFTSEDANGEPVTLFAEGADLDQQLEGVGDEPQDTNELAQQVLIGDVADAQPDQATDAGVAPSLLTMVDAVEQGQAVEEPPVPERPKKAKVAKAKADKPAKDWSKTTFRRWGTTSRKTGATLGMYNAEHPEAATAVQVVGGTVDVRAAEGEGRWVVVDESHGTTLRGGNMDKVYVDMFSPEKWCKPCSDIVAGKAPKVNAKPAPEPKAPKAAKKAADKAETPAQPKAAAKGKGAKAQDAPAPAKGANGKGVPAPKPTAKKGKAKAAK